MIEAITDAVCGIDDVPGVAVGNRVVADTGITGPRMPG
jgi:hypothetical protein